MKQVAVVAWLCSALIHCKSWNSRPPIYVADLTRPYSSTLPQLLDLDGSAPPLSFILVGSRPMNLPRWKMHQVIWWTSYKGSLNLYAHFTFTHKYILILIARSGWNTVFVTPPLYSSCQSFIIYCIPQVQQAEPSSRSFGYSLQHEQNLCMIVGAQLYTILTYNDDENMDKADWG